MIILKKILSNLRGEQIIDKLIKRGLKIGSNYKIMGGCILDPSHCWHIHIGDNVTLAPRVHILAHDASTKQFLGYTKVANVVIGNNVFIGAGVIILPGVHIGDNVIIGAGSIVSKDIPENSVAIGAPAMVVGSIENYIDKEKQLLKDDNTFGEDYTLRNKNFSQIHIEKMLLSLKKHGKIFIE